MNLATRLDTKPQHSFLSCRVMSEAEIVNPP